MKQIESAGMLASVDFNMFKIGCTAARAAVRHLKKEPLPEKVMLAGGSHRQDQLQGLAGAGRAARLPGMERRRALSRRHAPVAYCRSHRRNEMALAGPARAPDGLCRIKART